MTVPWMARLPVPPRQSLPPLRPFDAMQVLPGDPLWLRGPRLDDVTKQALLCLPGVAIYAVVGESDLCLLGRRVPHASAPNGEWISIADYLKVTAPVAALPGQTQSRVALRLVPSTRQRDPNLLLARWSDWHDHALRSPTLRLSRLQFAYCPFAPSTADAGPLGLVALRGTPLPSIEGTFFVEEGGIAIPAGWKLSLPVPPAVLRPLIELGPGETALLVPQREGELRVQRLGSQCFVAATRAAVRATAEAAHVSA